MNGDTIRSGSEDANLALTGRAGSLSSVFVIGMPVSVLSIKPVSGTSNTAIEVDFEAVLNESVTGVSIGDFILTRTDSALGMLSIVNGTSPNYVVRVTSISEQ